MIYAALLTALVVKLGAVARALIVSDDATEIGFAAENWNVLPPAVVAGVDPFVV
jgi:hypothetical protein